MRSIVLSAGQQRWSGQGWGGRKPALGRATPRVGGFAREDVAFTCSCRCPFICCMYVDANRRRHSETETFSEAHLCMLRASI